MKPVTYDFDVVTDTPRIKESPKRRQPEPAEQAPQADADEERSAGQRFALPEDRQRAAPPDQERDKVRAAE